MRSPTRSGIDVLWVLLVVATLVAAPVQAAPETATEAPTASEAESDPVRGAVVFYDQESSGEKLVVAQANLSAGGFVALFEGSRNGTLLGTSAHLDPGPHENVDVDLTTEYSNDTTVVAVLYRDANDNRTFDPTVDEPYRNDETAVEDTAYVTLARPAETATATVTATTPSAATDTTVVDTASPGFGVLAALAALLLAAAFRHARR